MFKHIDTKREHFPAAARPQPEPHSFDSADVPLLARAGCRDGRSSVGVRTRGDGGCDRLTSALVPEGHQVDGVLLPGTQATLQEGGDGAGQLCRHAPIVVLEVEGRHTVPVSLLGPVGKDKERFGACVCPSDTRKDL